MLLKNLKEYAERRAGVYLRYMKIRAMARRTNCQKDEDYIRILFTDMSFKNLISVMSKTAGCAFKDACKWSCI